MWPGAVAGDVLQFTPDGPEDAAESVYLIQVVGLPPQVALEHGDHRVEHRTL
jgi:hypothetical protein